jgi:hypothetical protein
MFFKGCQQHNCVQPLKGPIVGSLREKLGKCVFFGKSNSCLKIFIPTLKMIKENN